MTSTIRDRILDRIAPIRPGDLSRLDLLDRPALKLDDTADTGMIPVVASRRPVAANPAAPRPIAASSDQFGPMPVRYGADASLRRAAIGVLFYAVSSFGLVSALLWAIGIR